LGEQIHELDTKIERMCREKYPETARLQQVPGVGPVTALTYVLTLEDPARFSKSRQVGPFIGLTPRRDQSGGSDKQLRITKAGDKYLRQLLVGCAQYILGPFGPDSDLRRYGLSIAARGGKNAKKRAAVAVARKLAVLLHRLWISEDAYESFHLTRHRKAA
jgi:transposase